MTTIRFWGVRGSVPAPPTNQELRKRDPALRFYGGNTSCVEVVMNGQRFILDMGTGITQLGKSLMKEMFEKGGLSGIFLLSHVHWDHIQGLPFFPPLYRNKADEPIIRNQWAFYGGTDWQKNAEKAIREQMSGAVFPVSWDKIKKITYHPIEFADVYDGMSFSPNGVTQISCRELDHPQETYGWRMQSENGTVVAYTTDNEPRDPRVPDRRLIQVAKKARVWITDCQYTWETYHGKKDGFTRHGWGHSYPEAVVVAAVEAEVETIVLFHHDPGSNDEAVLAIENHTKNLLRGMGASHINVIAAYEGLTINL